MNRRLITQLLIIFITSWSFLGAPLSTYAHDEEAYLKLNVTQAQPGTVDDHSDLTQVIQLSADLISGAYEVHVADTHHVASTPLSIVADSSDDEDGSQRGEDEPLLASIPTQIAGTGHSTAAPTTSTTISRPTAKVEPPIPISLLFSSALAIVILVVSLFIISRRSR